MGADVFFMDMTATSRENLPQKLERLVTAAGLHKAVVSIKEMQVVVGLHEHVREFGKRNPFAFTLQA